MNERSDTTPHALQLLLLEGRVTHKFSFFGQEVVMDLFPAGTNEDILRQVSGLDEGARNYIRSVLSVAHALVSIGNWNFNNSYDEKLKTVRALMMPLQGILIEELLSAQLKQHEDMVKRHELLKKSSPVQS